MFANVGWGEMMILLIAGLVILGPERLPGAMKWTTNALKQVREYANGATSQLKQDLGPEFEELRQPLADLQKLRGMTPRAAITKHLLDGDGSFFDDFNPDSVKLKSPNGPTSQPTGGVGPSLEKQTPERATSEPLGFGERPPIDLDAT